MDVNKLPWSARGGRTIGAGRDEAAPTAATPPVWDIPVHLLTFIIGDGRDKSGHIAATPPVWDTPVHLFKSITRHSWHIWDKIERRTTDKGGEFSRGICQVFFSPNISYQESKCMSIQSINPATGEVIETFEVYSEAQINEALDQARRAFREWRETTFAERGALFHRIASHLRDHKAELARTATLEMGKPIVESEAEVEKCAWNCDYYADNAEKFLADEHVATNATDSYVAFQPLGVVLALMPWNFPYWQVFRFGAPALMAGNTAVLKHASNVSRCALEIEQMFSESGFPQGIFKTVIVTGAETGKLIADPRVAAVTLTGSGAAGVAVASACGG